FAVLGEERAERGTGATSYFLLCGGGVVAAGDGTSVTARGLAGVGERDPRPGTDADHAAGDAAAAGRAVLKPEGLRSSFEDADAEASDRAVPEDFLLLLRPEPGLSDHHLVQLGGFGHSHICVSTSSPFSANDPTARRQHRPRSVLRGAS